ncbi:helix-turn-helix transcriptional regulator [Azospirillum sp. SYSU D00513]|uniref:helix-turn-helix transcriptional regulator n=1 Tax=Azospirillum sp. SYSU D00513 TaxID=2812561 RepID=UPI001A9797A8|nr:helix-turn-helix transcriptional regulator [Azospirillum sp. SYSU D00513]
MRKLETTGQRLSQQLRQARQDSGLTQQDVAERLGRTRGRLSELEAGLAEGKALRDRLSLFLDMAEALGVVPVLVPRSRIADVEALLEDRPVVPGPASPPRVLDEVFVDLSGEDDEE